MRRIRIDFLTPAPGSGSSSRWLPAGLWISVLAFAAWEITTGLELLAESDRLSLATTRSEQISSTPPGLLSAGALKNEALSVSALLAGTERAIGEVRKQAPDLRLESLVLDSSHRTLIVRGKSAHPQPIDQLMTGLRSAFPEARTGFPDIRNDAGRVSFEIRLHYAPTGTGQ